MVAWRLRWCHGLRVADRLHYPCTRVRRGVSTSHSWVAGAMGGWAGEAPGRACQPCQAVELKIGGLWPVPVRVRRRGSTRAEHTDRGRTAREACAGWIFWRVSRRVYE